LRAFTEGLREAHIAADISDAAAASDAAHRFATVSPAALQQSRQRFWGHWGWGPQVE